MLINKRKAVSIIIFLFLLCIAIVGINIDIRCDEDDYYSISKFITVYSIINLVIVEICLIKYEKRINFFELFLALCYLFLFGQCYAIALFNNLGRISIFNIATNSFGTSLVYKSALYVTICSIAMSIGYIFFYDYKLNKRVKENKENNIVFENKKTVQTIAWLFLIISIIPTIVICYKDITLQKIYGYGATLIAPSGIDKVLNIFKGLFNSAILILIISEEGKKKKISYSILIAYLLFEMLGGTRIQAFKFIVILLFLYFENNTISIKKIVHIGLGILCIAFVFTIISASRMTNITINNIGDLLKENNLIYDVLFECGHTQTLLMVVLAKCPDIVDYEYGMSLVRALSSAIPNFGIWDVHPAMITVDSVFSPLYTNKTGMGSSIFAIAYWNFGIFGGSIAMMVFGMLIAQIIKSIYNTNDFSKKIIGYYLLYFISFLVRGDIEQFGRNFLFYCLFPLFVVKLYSNMLKRKRNCD